MLDMFSCIIVLIVACTPISATASKWRGDGDCPWGNRTVQGSHPQYDMPDTGETRYYDFNISRATLSPDGVSMSLLVANGQFPGPLIEANWGDWIEVNVHNEIYGPEEGVTLHYHGLNQPGTPWFDGVAAVAQCPIAPGTNLTYRFRADEYGSSWWHSHLSAQYTQGLFGPLVVHGPNHVDYDEDLGVISITDWYHAYYADIVANVTAPALPGQPYRPFANSNLVGGVGRFPCANITDGTACTMVPYASWQVEPGKIYRARFVNTGSSAFEVISIDNHTMTVIANDFVPVEPYATDFVTLGVGQRTDVIFTATGSAGDSFWIRGSNLPNCADTAASASEGKAILAYPTADLTVDPTSVGLPAPANSLCGNDALSSTVPVYQIPAAQNPELTITVDVTSSQTIDPTTGKGPAVFTMNNSSFVGDLTDPLLLATITQDATSFPAARNVYSAPSNITVRIVFNNNFFVPHPMHLHGHDFQVLAEGHGAWDGTIVNPQNPQRRDVQMAWFGANATNPAVGPNHLVLQFQTDNPGLWVFHCHVAWHLSAGLLMTILEGSAELETLTANIPQSVKDTCTNYGTWATANDVGNATNAMHIS